MSRAIRKIANRCQILAAVMFVSAPLAAGCSECAPGATRCQGDDVLSTCTADSDAMFATAHWDDTKCTVACREVGGDAQCVSAPDPVPECQSGEETCYLNTPTSCRNGYPIRHTPCSGNSRCVISASCGAMCAIDDSPDPRCAASPFCDGEGNLSSCSCDFVVARASCGSADLCKTLGGDSRCTETATPDPRCGDPGQKTSGFCNDDAATFCWFGFVAGQHDCAAGRCVETAGQPPACEPAP